MARDPNEKRKITQAHISQDLGNSSALRGAQTKSESEVVPASATPRPLDRAKEEPSARACSDPARGSWTTLASLTSSERMDPLLGAFKGLIQGGKAAQPDGTVLSCQSAEGSQLFEADAALNAFSEQI